MDSLENKTPVQPDSGDLQAQYDALRHMIVSLMVLVIIISGTLNIYLLRQWRSTSKDLTAIRPQATQMIAEFQKVSGPVMQDFVKKITDYGRTHPDFAPILVKYGLTNPPSTLPTTSAPKK